jgi:hypothetical protein
VFDAAFNRVCRRRRPGSSTAAASSVSPELYRQPRTAILLKRNPTPPATLPSNRAASCRCTTVVETGWLSRATPSSRRAARAIKVNEAARSSRPSDTRR